MRNILIHTVLILCFTSVFAQKNENDFTIRLRQQNEIEYEASLIEASKQTMLGNYNDAMSLYMKCLSLYPQSSAAMYEMARIFYINKDINASVELMTKVVSLSPKNVWYNLFYFQLLKQKKQFDKAETVMKNIIKLAPDNDLNYYELASIYIQQKNFCKAEKLYKQMETVWGTSPTLSEEVVKLAIEQNNISKSKKLLHSLIEKYPNEERYYLVLMDINKQIKAYDDAIDIAKKYLATFPDNNDMEVELFKLYYSKPDTILAMQQLQKLVAIPSIPAKSKSLIFEQIQKDKIIKSFSNYEDDLTKSMLLVHPDDIDVHLARARYCIKANKTQDAQTELYYVLNKDKSNAEVFEQLLQIEIKEGNWKAVNELCTQAIQYYPVNANLYFYAGFSAWKLEKFDDAINVLLTGCTYATSQEQKGQFYMYLGESYFKLNDHVKCYYFFDKSITAFPTNDGALNNYSYYLSLTKDSLSKALEMTKLSNKLSPKNPVYLDTYAWVLFKLGRYIDAKIKIEEAISFGGSSNSEIVEHYGDILFKNGMEKEALDSWIKAKNLGGNSNSLDKKISLKSYTE